MLGLERVLTEDTPRTATGTELRRHQVDALTGMLAELIASTQRSAEENGNGNGSGNGAVVAEAELDEDADDDFDAGFVDEKELEPAFHGADPGAVRRYRFRHPTASGKTIAAAGFVEAARELGILILTHRRLLVSQFTRDLTTEGYGDRFADAVLEGRAARRARTRSRSRPTPGSRATARELDRETYHLVLCDEAHTALGEKTSAAIRAFHEPLYIGMTATEQLIAKQVSDVFPASVDDLPLGDAARRGLIAPLRCLRVPPAAAINSVPIVGGDFEERALAAALDHEALNQAAASLYRDRFGSTPGIVYAAGVDHAYNLAQEFRAAGLKAEAVSGKTPPARLAETLAAYERGEINVLINAQLLAEGWNSPRATVCMHLAPTASRRVYQQRIGRIMRMHPRKEAGVVVDFVPKGSTHNERVVSLHALLDADFYREGARVTPAPRRRQQRRARRKLSPVPWLVPVTPDVARRLAVIQREWQRIDPKYLDEDEQRFWATIAGRQIRFDQRAEFARKFTEGRASKVALEHVPLHVRRREPEPAAADHGAPRPRRDPGRARRLRRPRHARDAGADRGRRTALRASACCCARSARARPPRPSRSSPAGRGVSRARRARCRTAASRPSSRRRSGCSARSRTRAGTATRRTSTGSSRSRCRCRSPVGAALLASADGYTPRANAALDKAREELGTIGEIATALADNLPAPKLTARKSRRRRRKRKGQQQAALSPSEAAPVEGRRPRATATPRPPRRQSRWFRRSPSRFAEAVETAEDAA